MSKHIGVGRLSRRTRVMALGAAGAVLLGGIGITSLAAWTDQEFVQGGFNGSAGVGSSTFDVLQSVAGDSGAFTDRETTPGGVIDFSSLASTLSPGATVYGWVQLKTGDASVDGTLALKSSTADATGLAQYLSYGATIVPDTDSCTESGFTTAAGTASNVLTAAGAAVTSDGAQTFSLAADGAETKTVCFQIHMQDAGVPDSAMGLTFTPIWYFDAISS
jgi:predicted ribosomally synthesized peptide with SipW-like signal peptide